MLYMAWEIIEWKRLVNTLTWFWSKVQNKKKKKKRFSTLNNSHESGVMSKRVVQLISLDFKINNPESTHELFRIH